MFLSRLDRLLRQSALRQTIGLLAALTVLSGLAFAGTYWLVTREMERLVDARLEARLDGLQAALERETPLPAFSVGQSYGVFENGKQISGNLDHEIAESGGASEPFDLDMEGASDHRHLIRHTGRYRIVVTENVERQEELLEVLANGLLFAVFGSLGLVLLIGLWSARRAQSKLNLISAGLARVADGHLDTRITLPGRPDDLTQLAERVNTTTERLALSMEQMRVQSSNIAHDLRTPLARLRAHLETQMSGLVEHGRPVSEQALDQSLSEVDRIVGIFDALLRIARIESGARRSAFAPVDLGSLVQTAADIFEPVIEDAGQRLAVDIASPDVIQGDHDMLIQFVANLLQNAMRYGANGQTITVSAQGSTVCVTDQGPGIPVEARVRVLEPLYQLDQERQDGGYGLGLSMVRAIAELHSASLHLDDGPGGVGLSVQLRFPETSC